MISYIRGELISADSDVIIVEAGGIGYNINVPLSILDELPSVGEEVRIHTHFQVREDAMQLFGFLTRDELQLFRLLIGVNGIGPKAGLSILSTLGPDDLRFAVLSGDSKAIARAQGVGSKTAQKVILELKDKLNLEDAFEQKLSNQAVRTSRKDGDALSEASQALVALGYSATDAMKAVRSVEGAAEMDTEALLKQALKKIMIF